MAQLQQTNDAVLAQVPNDIFSLACHVALERLPERITVHDQIRRGVEHLFTVPHYAAMKEVLTASGIDEAKHLLDETVSVQRSEMLIMTCFLWLEKRTGLSPFNVCSELHELTRRRKSDEVRQRLAADENQLAVINAIGFIALAIKTSNDPGKPIDVDDLLRECAVGAA